MAKIKWNDLAASQLENHLDYALEEFGQKCVRLQDQSPWFPTSICFISLPRQLSSNSHFLLPSWDIEPSWHHDFVTRCGLE